MNTQIVWRFFLESNRQANAERALRGIIRDVSLEMKNASLSPYEKGGFVAEIRDTIEASSWESAVFIALERAQTIRAEWCLTGVITEELNLWAHKVRHPGVTAVGAVMLRGRPGEWRETLDLAGYLFEHRAENLPPKALAEIFDRVIWVTDDNGAQICKTIERWLRSDDRARIEVALLTDGIFPFESAAEMDTELSRIAERWPELATLCRSKSERRHKQNPAEYR